MPRRKVEKELNKWKMNNEHKPLIIKGLRQSGKTYSVVEFAKNHYENVIYINFQKNENYKKIFDNSLEIENIKMQISSYFSDAQFVDGKTLDF